MLSGVGGIKEGFAGLFMNSEGAEGTPCLALEGVFAYFLLSSCNSQGSAIPPPLIQTLQQTHFMDGWVFLYLLPVPTGNSFALANLGPQL